MAIIRFIILVSIINFLYGCGASRYSTLPPSPSKLEFGQSVSRKISAKGEWRSTGIIVEINDILNINAEGTWSLGSSWGGPDGRGQSGLDDAVEACYDNAFPAAALIGKINDGEPFLIGNKKKHNVKNSGLLYFRINTANIGLWNNKGFVNVSIKHNNQTISTSNIPAQSAPIIPYTPHRTHRNWAVIIGISQYQYSGQKGLTNLIFADDDAKSFARSLHNLGWNESHIKLLTNEEATQRNIMIALESWLSKAGPNDQIILFGAGHGFPDPEDPEKVYFACYDTDISIPATGYRMD